MECGKGVICYIDAWNLFEFEDEDYLQKRREIEQKIIADNVLKMLDEEKKGGRREKLKKLKNLNEDALWNGYVSDKEEKPEPEEPVKKESIYLPDWKFYKEKEKLISILEKEQQAKFDPRYELTEEEKVQKKIILSESFDNWTFREYNKLLTALDFCLPDEYDRISKFIGTKTEVEVKDYLSTLLTHYKSLHDYSHIKHTLKTTKGLLSYLWTLTPNPPCAPSQYWKILPQASQKSKTHSKESDIQLLKLTHKYGYGNFFLVKKALKNTGKSRFNHVLLSKSESDLQKRIDYLLKGVRKEASELCTSVGSDLAKELIEMERIVKEVGNRGDSDGEAEWGRKRVKEDEGEVGKRKRVKI